MTLLAKYLIVGPPLPQRLRIPTKHRRTVAWLLKHPVGKTFDFARYLRYNLVVHGAWAIPDAKSIADGTYPWDQDGFSCDSEGNIV
jgi:hypothetical protein